MFKDGVTLQQFKELADIHNLTGEERLILMYRFGIGDGIVRTFSEVVDIMNRKHNHHSEHKYELADIRFTESIALRAINGPEKGA